jgi:hypothetical protein
LIVVGRILVGVLTIEFVEPAVPQSVNVLKEFLTMSARILTLSMLPLLVAFADCRPAIAQDAVFYRSFHPTPVPHVAPSSYVVHSPHVVYATPVFSHPPVFVTPPTVVVQRPVVVAQPVVVPEPVFVEVPAGGYVQPAPMGEVAHATSYRYRPPRFPFFNHDKTEYRVHTPEGTHRYVAKTSWWTGRTKVRYSFNN